jgi:hypothetical protein
MQTNAPAGTDFTRSLSTETVSVSDSIARLLAATRALATETVTSNGGSLARMLAANRSLVTETTTIGENLERMTAFSRTIPETTNISDQLNRKLAATRTLATETVTVNDQLNRMLAATRILSDTKAITHQLNYVKTLGGGGTNYERALTEVVAISDSLNNACSKQKFSN